MNNEELMLDLILGHTFFWEISELFAHLHDKVVLVINRQVLK